MPREPVKKRNAGMWQSVKDWSEGTLKAVKNWDEAAQNDFAKHMGRNAYYQGKRERKKKEGV